jgi:hypothetical protein
MRVVAASALVGLTLWLVQAGTALPSSLGSYFFGPKLIRAEVVLKSAGVQHDYRIDRGKIRGISSSSITLRERDQTIVTIPVAPTVEVKLGGVPSSLGALRPRMTATVIRDGDGPATTIVATRR